MASLPSSLAIQIVEACPAPLIVLSDHARIVYLNQAAVQSFGYPLTEVSGRPVPDVFVSPTHHAAVMEQLHRRARGEPSDSAVIIDAVDRRGRLFPAEIRVRALEAGSDAWTLLHVNDLRTS